ncbi:hypothetical protein D3C77_771090 [compost metagenome]
MIRYSNQTMPQLMSAAITRGLVFRVIRWPYQAKVMKALDKVGRAAVCIHTGMI